MQKSIVNRLKLQSCTTYNVKIEESAGRTPRLRTSYLLPHTQAMVAYTVSMQAFSRVVVPHILTETLLEEKKVFMLAQVQRNMMPWTEKGITNIEYMRQYMAKVGSQQISTQLAPWAIYECYSESRLQRLFLRRCVLLQTGENQRGVVIAGSFAAHTYQCSIGAKPAWAPNDIDIFVTQPDLLRTIQRLYTTVYVKPLGKRLRRRIGIGSFKNHIHTNREGDPDVQKEKDERPFDRERLPMAIEEFLLESTSMRTNQSIAEGMRSIPAHLPLMQKKQAYTVQKTLVLRAVPRCNISVNVIYIQISKEDTQKQHKSLAHAICSEFDMAQCAISLDVNNSLQYTTEAHVKDTKELLETKKMRLMPSAFTAPRKPLETELHRIVKYLERSFTW